MANAGYFCFLVPPTRFAGPDGADALRRAFVAFAGSKPHLKNLAFAPPRYDDYACERALHGDCDRLRPEDVREFLGTLTGFKGLRAFVIDSAYGDDWQEVTPE